MTYLDPDHRPTRAAVAHARAELRPRRNSDQFVAAFALVVALAWFIACALLLHALVPGGIRP